MFGFKKHYQKTVADMTMRELVQLRARLFSQMRKIDNPRLDIQLHAVQGELKDRGYVTKKNALMNGHPDSATINKGRL